MIKKISFLIVLLLFITQCGYQPIYSSKNIKFNIKSLKINGDLKIGNLVARRLKNFSKDTASEKSYEVGIFSSVSKNTTAKDKKGNPKLFTINVEISLETINSLNKLSKKTFNEFHTYENNENKFELKRYEDSLKENLTEKIIQDIMQYLQNLS